ncbi:MAG: T9SS type A sorting domain-containing protein [Ignavibacteriota bacterium]|nr:T9SS type A sorting domain-containing protein [Ignavibacteriales bacterium]QKJ98198.1 MAG: T9SS type A sorting domain-containing protein [Ignavibacteriota bacterium]HOJ06654.1 T9SS type A sorting domain-containing protein [Ignavibacteriaceae bacterium]
MKRSFIFLMIIILYTPVYFCQTVDGQFITNISPPTYSVTIAVNLQSGTGTAGVVEVDFTFNTNALSIPITPVKDTDYILYGDFNTYSGHIFHSRPSANTVRIYILTMGSPLPVPISTTPTNIVTFYFTITDTLGNSNLIWTKTNIAPSFLSLPYTKGNWYNLNEQSLPVELSSFTAKFNEKTIKLNWLTKTEVNNYGFNVERRINEGEWNTLGFVEGHGNSNLPKQYSYTDNDLFSGGSKFQYRLKQIDTDGKFEYSDVVEVEIVPEKFELSQNYPNPFNPSTTIRFSIPKETRLKINIYNMLGELVETIADGTYEAGYHKVTFSAIGGSASGGNAFSLPSGAYIYRFESPDFVQVRKMILIK